METKLKFLLNYIDGFDLISSQNSPSPIKTERFDEWNEEKKYNRYRRVSDGSDRRERRGRSRSRERLKSSFRQRSRSRDRRGQSNSRFHQRSRSRDRRGRSSSRFHQRSRSRDRRGRSNSRFHQRPRSRDRRGRSNSRFHQRSRSRDRRGRSNSQFHQRSRSSDRRGRSNSRFHQRSRSRDRSGRSNSRFLKRSRSRDRRGPSKSRFRQRSKSRFRQQCESCDRHGRSKSIDKYYHDRSDRTEKRSEYSRSDRNAHDYIDKHNPSSQGNVDNSSIDRDVSREYNGRSGRSGSRVYKRENKHERIDTYSTITDRDQYEVAKVMDYDSGSDTAIQLKNWTYKHKYNKPSSTVTSSDIQRSAAHFNDTSQTDEAAESLKYQQIKDVNDREEGTHSQYQMEEITNPNNLQSPFSSLPANRVRRNPFATDVPFQNYTGNVSNYRFSINDNVELPKYQQPSSSNATTTYGQHKQQNLQVAPSVSKISKSHLDNVYGSGEYSIPSLYANSKLSQKFRIPKKKPICTVTQQSSRRGGYDSADLQYELSGNIDQRPNEKTIINNNKSKKPSPTDIQRSIVKASSPALPKDQTTVKKKEEVQSLFKKLLNPNGMINPSGLVTLINLCGKISDAGKSNEMIQTTTTQTNPNDTSEQNDTNLMTTTKAEEIMKVKKSKRKRSIWSSRPKSKKKSRSTKAVNPIAPSTNKNIKQKAKLKDDVTKPILRSADTKLKLKADVVKPKKPYEPSSSISYSLRRGQNTAVSYAEQEVDASEPESPKKLRKVPKSNKRMKPTIVADHSPGKRVKRALMERDVTLHKINPSDSDETLKPSDSDEGFSPTAGTRTNKNKKRKVGATPNRRRLSAIRKRIASEVVPELESASRQQFTKVDDVKHRTEPSTIKNNNPQWHYLNQRLECLHCDKNTGMSLANHYVTKHPDCEVFPCRLPPDIAEFLRNTTEEHKCERRKQEDKQPYEFRQRCYFCDKFKLYTKKLWLQHYSVHTGCYEFQCKYCRSTFSTPKKDHHCTRKNNCVRKFEYPPFHRRDRIVYGYVCDLCNFTRFEQSEIEKHLRCEHEGEVDGKFKKLVLLTFPKKKKKHEIKAEQALKLAAIKAATENKSLNPLISNNDDDDIVIVITTDDDNHEIVQKTPKGEADIDTTRTIEENMTIVILDSDDDWISCSDDDEINDNISTNLQPLTSTQVGYVEILPEISSQVEEVIIKTESDSQTTESLWGTSQQQNDMVSPTNQSARKVPDANMEESNESDAATACKKIVIEARTQADNEIANIIATNFSSINGCLLTLNATSNSNPESENEKCSTESLNDSILSNMDDDTVDMNEFNFGTNVQTETDSDQVTTVQQSNIQSPEKALTQSTFDETGFLKISYVTSLAEQSSSSATPNEFELTDIAGVSNEIFTNEEFKEIMEEMVGSPNTGTTFSDLLNDFETLCDQQSTSTETAKMSMMQEIVELPDKTSKVSTTPTRWTTMQHEIVNANLAKGTGLAGSDLYRCCLTDCDEKYTDSSALEMHLLSHDQTHRNLKCYHCPMACETIASLIHHIESHGIHRYVCVYCLYTNTTLYNVGQHMREAHDQDTIDSIPFNRNEADDTNDLFLVFPTRLEEEVLISFGSTLIE